MKSKRLILLIVAVLLLSLTTPALAANQQTKVTASCSLPDIKIDVVVPSGTKAYINPQKLPVKVGGSIYAAAIFSDEAHIENKSTVPLKVSASVKGTVKTGSDMTLATASFDTSSTTAKKAFLYVDMQAVNDPANVTWIDDYDPDHHIIVSTSTKTKQNAMTLAAGGEDASEDAVRYGAFRLAGICTEWPTKAWTSKDGVNVEIVFTFTALPLSTVIESTPTE